MRDRSEISPLRGARRVAGALGGAAVALLVLFHLLLLAERIARASILDPATSLRWLGAAAALGLALVFRRTGSSLIAGRSGLVFWALVLLLHVGAGGSPLDPHRAPLVLLGTGLAAGALLALAAPAARRRRRIAIAVRSAVSRAVRPPRLRLPDLLFGFVPRPPPAV
jgi:hypothetical protein